MEKQAQQNLLSFIKGITSTLGSVENTTLGFVKKDYCSIHNVISNIRNYTESLKNLVFRRVITLTYKREINIKEFNEINDCLNIQFNLVEEFIDDNLFELYDRNTTSFMEIYFNIESGLESIYETIREL